MTIYAIFELESHKNLIEIQPPSVIDNNDTRILGNLYWKQMAAIKINQEIS